jgi:hypothetical protein
MVLEISVLSFPGQELSGSILLHWSIIEAAITSGFERYHSSFTNLIGDRSMTIALTSPVTGSAQTGLTSPTYTVVADTPPNAYSKQWAVTALGGTQTSVEVHGASKPFTVTFSRPQVIRSAPALNPVTGVMPNSPRNVYSVIVRKGASPGANQNPQICVLRCDLSVAAGADLQEPEDIRAALSLLIGSMTQQSAGLGDTLINALL